MGITYDVRINLIVLGINVKPALVASRVLRGHPTHGASYSPKSRGAANRRFSHARIPSAYGIPGHQAGGGWGELDRRFGRTVPTGRQAEDDYRTRCEALTGDHADVNFE